MSGRRALLPRVKLERVEHGAVATLGLGATIEKVEDYPTIMRYGVMSTPALVIDNKVLLSGRVPTPSQVRDCSPHSPGSPRDLGGRPVRAFQLGRVEPGARGHQQGAVRRVPP